MAKELREYQVADLSFYMMNPRCMNLSDPGTGKTPSVCAYLWYLWDHLQERSVWSMPKSLLKKNLDELLDEDWTGFGPEDCIIVDGTPKQREKQMASDAKVFLMGFDCFATNWPRLLELHPDINMHASDEIHMGFGGPTSKRTQSMYEAMKHIEKFLPMTGTIINGRLSSVYPCMHVINPKLYADYDSFEMRHSIKDAYGHVVSWTNTKPIAAFLGQYGIRHTFEEAYGPEAKHVVFEQCEMVPAQKEAYEEFEETALLELEESWLDGSLPGVNFIRCRQLMEHPRTFGEPLDKIKTTGKEERIKVHLTHAKETGQPLVIYSALVPSQENLVKIGQDMGLRVGLINGNTSRKKRVEIDEAFRNGDLDLVVASPATASVGFNWGHVDHVIFASLDPMDSNFVQAYRRAIRGKRETALLITILEYEKSMDQRLFQIVEKKMALSADVQEGKERIDMTRTGKKRKGNIKQPGEKLSMSDFVK